MVQECEHEVIGVLVLAPGAEGQFDMTPLMLQTFLFSLLTFTFIFVDLLWHRIRVGRLADKVEQLRLKTIQ